ncbi:CatB-related O-acetyltransferase [Pseudomonas sp. CCI3.2]|nr:CatB-related O-acetyltransferase [Pseudomonas sp. MH10]MEB0076471.1 CatB-related O-acetyltransferase [Pseudomonas sp. MH10out]MEB0091180.1 CatB-related O-acetyltransferase [Pseudomonas sp. CCI4.2]MEB0100866.1 CatB-related O-acetyltransferase [Pseudomonas sp. CCI3.2]MEB0119598.1 CatB-related O-acetyltransferase [Pseudomonas sp. CCI1.2]MEB0128749.1 CatB-related O-acetyltransferase [Pseudomonas sp. CCI2.4]MEB0157024.1 CatB-related O-acetyltransferase [Pseudomonas sp. AH2 (2023)]MEB0169830.1 
MNLFKRALLDRKLKKTLWKNKCRFDSGTRGLRCDTELTLEEGVKLHQVNVRSSKLRIGAYTDIVSGSELHHVSSIGRYCSVAKNVTIGQDRKSHPLSWLTSHTGLVGLRQKFGGAAPHHSGAAQTTIGHDVWIGMDVLILEGVTIGTGAVIGAQSLVSKDVPPYAIVAGSPAKVIRYRFDQPTIDGLLASQWWNMPLKELAELPIETPDGVIKHLQGRVVSDCNPGTVVIRSKPFSVTQTQPSFSQPETLLSAGSAGFAVGITAWTAVLSDFNSALIAWL